MLAVTAILYYVTYPFQSRPTSEAEPLSFLQNALRRPAPLTNKTPSPSLNLWKILNPDNDPFLHVRIETPVIATLNVEGNAVSHMHTRQDLRSHGRLMRRTIWLFKTIVLPIAGTTGCLYLLLLYLLRGADQLEAHRTQPDNGPTVCTPSLEGKVTFSTLPRVFPTDVSLIATNHNASVIAILSTKHDLVIWNEGYSRLNVRDALSTGSSSPDRYGRINRLALDDGGLYCAIGTDEGVLAIWQIPPRGVPLDKVPHFVAINLSESIVDLTFLPTKRTQSGNSNRSATESTPRRTQEISLLAMCENGAVFQTSPMSNCGTQVISPTHPDVVFKAHFLQSPNNDQIHVAFSFRDGFVELLSRSTQDSWTSVCTVPAGSPNDPVVQLSLTSFESEDGSNTLTLVTATTTGVVSIYNAEKGECIRWLDNAFGDINKLRIASITPQKCHLCGKRTPDALALAFSVGYTVFLYRARRSSISERCSCSITQKPFLRDGFGRRSRSGSTASMASSSPPKVRSRLPSLTLAAPGFELANFPISPHGIHPRRAGSEREVGRRTSGSFSRMNSQLETDETTFNGAPGNDELTVELVADLNYERGGWELVDGHGLVGIRRRSRLQQPHFHADAPARTIATSSRIYQGELPVSVLDRWELWALDPGHPEYDVRVSSLLTLSCSSKWTLPKTCSESPRLPFTRISPISARATACVAGFGNTTGIVNLSQFRTA